MEINVRELRTTGKYIGETIWICDYNRPDLDKKPLRKVPPIKVKVFGNRDLPSNKTVYYSEVHFRPFNKKGENTSKIMSPVDNTGFRSNPGNELHAFDNEEECNQRWNELLEEHIERIERKILTIKQEWEADRDNLIGLKK